MKILNVNHLLDPVTGGGTAERTFQMSRALVKKGVGCCVLCLDIGLDDQRYKDLSGVDVVALPCVNKRYFIPGFSYRKIVEVVKSVDLIHLMGHWTFLNTLVYLIASRLGKPYVVCPAGALPLFGRSGLGKRGYNLLIGRRLIRGADGFIAISPDETDHFRQYGVQPERVVNIRNGINPDDFTTTDTGVFRQRLKLGEQPFALFVGRLNAIKGPDLLLEAFCRIAEQVKPYSLVFAGPDGGMLRDLKAASRAQDCEDRIKFSGYLGGSEKASAYAEADFLVVSSRQEAMSIVAIEAGASSTPVLITDQCGFDAVEEVGGGRVVSATVDGLSQGLLEMMQNRERLKEMGEELRAYTLECFTWDSIVDKLIRLYAGILGMDGRH